MGKQSSSWYGYVYLLKCDDLYKIGQSAKPRTRLRQLRTGSPYPIEVVHTLRSAYYKQIEKQLHMRFRDKRGSGEWFALTAEDVAHVKSLNSDGCTPEEAERRARRDQEWHAKLDAQRRAEEDRQLAVLLSGAAAGAAGELEWLEALE